MCIIDTFCKTKVYLLIITGEDIRSNLFISGLLKLGTVTLWGTPGHWGTNRGGGILNSTTHNSSMCPIPAPGKLKRLQMSSSGLSHRPHPSTLQVYILGLLSRISLVRFVNNFCLFGLYALNYLYKHVICIKRGI